MCWGETTRATSFGIAGVHVPYPTTTLVLKKNPHRQLCASFLGETSHALGDLRTAPELLKRTFGLDVLTCPCCSGRMKLLALVTEPKSVARYLRCIPVD